MCYVVVADATACVIPAINIKSLVRYFGDCIYFRVAADCKLTSNKRRLPCIYIPASNYFLLTDQLWRAWEATS